MGEAENDRRGRQGGLGGELNQMPGIVEGKVAIVTGAGRGMAVPCAVDG